MRNDAGGGKPDDDLGLRHCFHEVCHAVMIQPHGLDVGAEPGKNECKNG
jgi:hypothetical protein